MGRQYELNCKCIAKQGYRWYYA